MGDGDTDGSWRMHATGDGPELGEKMLKMEDGMTDWARRRCSLLKICGSGER